MGIFGRLFGKKSDGDTVVDDHEKEEEATPLEVALSSADDYHALVEARDESLRELNEEVVKLHGDVANYKRAVAVLEREQSVTREKMSRYRQLEELVDAGAPGHDLYERIKNTIQSNEISGSSLANAHRALQDQFQAKDRECARLRSQADQAASLVEVSRSEAARFAPLLQFLEQRGWKRESGVTGAIKIVAEKFQEEGM